MTTSGYSNNMDPVSERLAHNIKALREARGLTQHQMAKKSAVPRPTWATLEAGGANPTLAVLIKVANGLQVRLEELLGPPNVGARHHPVATLSVRKRGSTLIRKVLPESVAGFEMERMTLPPRAMFTGVPHTQGTREYFACERGTVELSVSGEVFKLQPGDVVYFPADQRHGYKNVGRGEAIAYSVVAFAPRG